MRQAIRYAAPGRVNLIGEHTDYNLGLALPIALPQRTQVTYLPNDTDVIIVRSDNSASEHGEAPNTHDTTPGDVTGWAAYVAGVVWALRRDGHRVAGGSMLITSDVETGSGLASSAALECAVLGALAPAGGGIDRDDQARIAQRAENEYVGAPTGLMDQLASLFGEPLRALLIDFREITVRPVTFDPDASDIALLLINSRTPHRHADGEYAAHRASCERAAADLGVASLRDVQDRGLSVLEAVADPVDARRARHVITENQRVLDFVGALCDSDYAQQGMKITPKHGSKS